MTYDPINAPEPSQRDAPRDETLPMTAPEEHVKLKEAARRVEAALTECAALEGEQYRETVAQWRRSVEVYGGYLSFRIGQVVVDIEAHISSAVVFCYLLGGVRDFTVDGAGPFVEDVLAA